VKQALRPLELGREDRQPRGNHDDGRPRQHEHGDADGEDHAAGDRDDDSAELSQHRTSGSSAKKLHAAVIDLLDRILLILREL